MGCDELGQYVQQQIVGNSHEQNRKIIRDRVVDLFKAEQTETGNGIKIEIILKIVKWPFIEHDITYWSFSGRAMLYNGLKNV
jgi:hypothetical protein